MRPTQYGQRSSGWSSGPAPGAAKGQGPKGGKSGKGEGGAQRPRTPVKRRSRSPRRDSAEASKAGGSWNKPKKTETWRW